MIEKILCPLVTCKSLTASAKSPAINLCLTELQVVVDIMPMNRC